MDDYGAYDVNTQALIRKIRNILQQPADASVQLCTLNIVVVTGRPGIPPTRLPTVLLQEILVPSAGLEPITLCIGH